MRSHRTTPQGGVAAPGDARGRLFRLPALAVVLCAAAALRLHGEVFYHPDEHVVVAPARGMLAQGSLLPHDFNWPSFYPNILTIAHRHLPFLFRWPGATRSVAITTQSARVVTAVFGTATVLVVYGIGCSLGWPWAGLAGAAFLALSLTHVENSHFATVDIPMTFNAALAFLCISRHFRSGRVSWAALGGLWCGVTIGTKYNAAPIVAPLLFSLLLQCVRRRPRAWAAAVVGVAAVPAGFLLANPYFPFLSERYLESLFSQMRVYSGGFAGYDNTLGPSNYLWNAAYLLQAGMGALPIALAVCGTVMLLLSSVSVGVFIASFPVCYYALISHQALHITRNLAVLTPFLSLAAGYALWRLGRLARRLPGGAAWAAILVAAALLQPLILSSRYALMLGRPDPRQLALDWACAQIPPGSRIAVDFMYGPRFPADRYSVISPFLGAKPISWYLDQGYDYIVTSSAFYPHWCPAATPAIATIYPELERDFARVALFPGNELGLYQGYYSVGTRPSIAVYDLRRPRYAAVAIAEPAEGSVIDRASYRVAWHYADNAGEPQSAYRLLLERRRPAVSFFEAEDLLAHATSRSGWGKQSHILAHTGSGFISAGRSAPPFRAALRLAESGSYALWVHQNCTRDGSTRISFGGISAQAEGCRPNEWRWQRLGTTTLDAGEHALAIEQVGGGYTVIDSLVLAADPGFDPARDGEWVTALDTGEVESAETEARAALFSGLPPGDYRIRVRARNVRGRWGIWSQPAAFRLAAAAPQLPPGEA